MGGGAGGTDAGAKVCWELLGEENDMWCSKDEEGRAHSMQHPQEHSFLWNSGSPAGAYH